MIIPSLALYKTLLDAIIIIPLAYIPINIKCNLKVLWAKIKEKCDVSILENSQYRVSQGETVLLLTLYQIHRFLSRIIWGDNVE